MSFAPLWLGSLAAILAQRSAAVGIEPDEVLVLSLLCACLLTAGGGLLVIGWMTA